MVYRLVAVVVVFGLLEGAYCTPLPPSMPTRFEVRVQLDETDGPQRYTRYYDWTGQREVMNYTVSPLTGTPSISVYHYHGDWNTTHCDDNNDCATIYSWVPGNLDLLSLRVPGSPARLSLLLLLLLLLLDQQCFRCCCCWTSRP